MNIIFEIKKLTNLQNNLEKSESAFLEQLTKYENDLKILSFYNAINQKRQNDVTEIQNDIQQILISLKDASLKAEHAENQDLDLQSLKREMITLQDNIEKFKQNCKTKLEQLCQEECLIWDQLNGYEPKLVKWEEVVKVHETHLKNKQKPTIQRKFAFETQEYLEFMNKHGSQDGWSTEDHNLFIKVRKKYKDPQKLAEYLNTLMPDISIEEILKHENWYQKYLQLREKQRNLITEWRNTKSSSQSKSASTSVSNIYVKEHYSKEEIQEKIRKWKLEKEKILFQKLEEENQEKKVKRQLEEQQKKANIKLKETVEKWKSEKAQKEKEEKIFEEMVNKTEKERRVAEAKKAIKVFQSRDNAFIERIRKTKRSATESSENHRSKNSAPRDTLRLLKPTKQWIQRIQRERNRKNEAILTLDIHQTPKLLGVHRFGKRIFHFSNETET